MSAVKHDFQQSTGEVVKKQQTPKKISQHVDDHLIAKKDGGQKICHFVKLDFQRSKSTVAKNSCRVSQFRGTNIKIRENEVI